jgi:hypothetical protein
MGSCKCGNKTVKFKTGSVKKATVKKAQVKKMTGGVKDTKPLSDRAKALSKAATAKATKKAKANASPCSCTQ